MIARSLLSPASLSAGKPLSFTDHLLFTGQTTEPYTCAEHLPGPGIITMLSGAGRFGINREMTTLDSSRFLLITQHSCLSIQLPRPDVQPFFLFFHPGLMAEALARLQADLAWLERVHPMNAVLRERLEWLARLGNNCSSFTALKADSIVREIIKELIWQAQAADETSRRLPVTRRSTRIELFKRLSLAREWILTHYASPVSLEDMADKATLNNQHFLRMFRDCYGITPYQFLIGVRLDAARRLLIDTKEPVSAICRQTGFESLPSFSGLFRKRFGAAPTTFRRGQSS